MMKRALIAAAVVLTFFGHTPAHAQKTKAQLNSEVSTNFPDNTTGAITPAILRATVNDMIASWQQYGGVNAQTVTNYTIALTDYGQLVTLNASSAISVTLPQATGSFQYFSFFIKNLGSAGTTITPVTSTINGAASLSAPSGTAFYIVSDGTNWQAVALAGGGSGGGGVTTVSNSDSTLTIAPTSGAVVSSLNLAHANTWTQLQTFSAAISASGLTLSGITGSGFQCLHVNATGVVSGLGSDCGTATGISTITSTGGTLAVTGTSTVNLDLALGHSNTWTAAQAFVGLTVRAASGSSFATIDTVATGTQAGFNLLDNGTPKWQFIRQTDDSFLIYDATAAQTVLSFAPSGVININPSAGHGVTIGGTAADPLSPGTLAATSLKTSVGTVVSTVASGALALSTTAIASGACSAAQTATATGTLTTDVVLASFNGDPTAVTGYIPSTNGMLTIIPYPTANTVNFKVCNNTGASITPGAVTVNWRVAR